MVARGGIVAVPELSHVLPGPGLEDETVQLTPAWGAPFTTRAKSRDWAPVTTGLSRTVSPRATIVVFDENVNTKSIVESAVDVPDTPPNLTPVDGSELILPVSRPPPTGP